MSDASLQTQESESVDTLKAFDGNLIQKICKDTFAGAGDQALLENLQNAFPGYPLIIARLGHEWYRLGGIIKTNGTRIANDVNEWTERTFIECGQDFETLLDHCEEQKFIVTQNVGVSLYLVAQTGPRAEEFIQIEVDRTQEMAIRHLIDINNPPEDLEEIIDPIDPVTVEPFAVGVASYTYKRKTQVALFMNELGRHRVDRHPAQRFMDDWNASSAANSRVFCHEWSLRLFQHSGRHGEQILNIEVVPNHSKELPRLEGPEGKKGKALATLVNRFDTQSGYSFAWYFHMLKNLVSPHVGEAVWKDISKDYDYLPECDKRVLSTWIQKPYLL